MTHYTPVCALEVRSRQGAIQIHFTLPYQLGSSSTKWAGLTD